eukprot:TRINITY_DN18648_c0_g1_i1.p1 TRINITY_DN18648_c0_g1~~TRINITY_DN18648_c0_g1_i1.p1  ORF type:complete len:434 (-),score=103.48 TRINITY_DN18648_c0_g1_i1:65-1366(-)
MATPPELRRRSGRVGRTLRVLLGLGVGRLRAAVVAEAPAVVAASGSYGSCAVNLDACLAAANMPQLQEVHDWVVRSPASAESSAIDQELPASSPLELGAFAFFREIGIAALASVLDFLLLCRGGDPRCTNPTQLLGGLPAQWSQTFSVRLSELVRGYGEESGVRSAVLGASRDLRRELDALAGELPRLGADASGVADRLASLAVAAGGRARRLARQLALHAWVRTLVVPGRGAPVFILHDEHASWQDMLSSLVGDMSRHAPSPQLALVELRDAADDEHGAGVAEPLLQSFAGLQYLGVLRAAVGADGVELQQPQAESTYWQELDRLKRFAERAVLRYASSAAAAASIPLRSLDVVLLALPADADEQKQEALALAYLELWERRVKPGGLLVGHGFAAGARQRGGVQAVCGRRFGTDIHLSADGGFWWFVEPEEE